MSAALKSRYPFDPKKRAAMQACLDHARALLDSARAVRDAGHPNIAYHLATLALEELGRRELLAIRTMASTRDEPPSWMQKHTQDHIKKLFWCFFGGGFLSEKWTKERLEGMQGIAQRIHAKRLAGLYADSDEDGLTIPADTITTEEAANLIDLADARLSMAEAAVPSDDISQEDLELQTWFPTAAEQPDTRRFIFSDRSLTKLAELGEARPWMLWIKQQLDEADAKPTRPLSPSYSEASPFPPLARRKNGKSA